MSPPWRMRASRLAALALLGGLTLAPAGIGAGLLGVYLDAAETARVPQHREVAGLTRLAPRLDELTRRLDATAAALRASNAFISEERPQRALGLLQDRVTGLVEEAGGSVVRMAPKLAVPHPDHVRLTLEFTFTAPADKVLLVLDRLETGTPVLLLQSVSMTPARPAGLIGAGTGLDVKTEVRLVAWMARLDPGPVGQGGS